MEKKERRAQISTEYLIVVSFVVFVILAVLGIATYYTSKIQDTVKFDEIEKSAKKIIYAAETTFYDGTPAKSTIEIYLPSGISNVTIQDDLIIFNVSSSSGQNLIAFPSSVPIEGSFSSSPGVKKILVEAQIDKVEISDA